MAKVLAAISVSLIILSGCINNYYYQVKDDKLHIYFLEPKAEKVFFLSSLDQFALHETVKNEKGLWEVAVPSGQSFEYFFLVDGIYSIPACDQKEKDDFGAENCIYIPDEDI
jgi:hypothetical protein